MDLSPALIWLLVGLGLLISELIVPGIILLFFGLGALLVSALCALGLIPGLTAQLLVFSVTSIVFLFALRKWIASFFSGKVTDDQGSYGDFDDLLGVQVKVTQAINAQSRTGKVEYKGANWSVVSQQNFNIGDTVKVVGIDGIKLLVEAV